MNIWKSDFSSDFLFFYSIESRLFEPIYFFISRDLQYYLGPNETGFHIFNQKSHKPWPLFAKFSENPHGFAYMSDTDGGEIWTHVLGSEVLCER